AIQSSGARTVLLCPAHLLAKYPKGFDELQAQHEPLAKDLKIPLAAGGKAWQAYLGETPTEKELQDLYHPDKGHPGPRGSYLYACTLYATITGKSPVDLIAKVHATHGAPDIEISRPEASRLGAAAWKACGELKDPK